MTDLAIPHSIRVEPHDALKRDFGVLIEELNKNGFPNTRIAYKCGVEESTVRNWKSKASDPPYHKAIIIIGMHYCYCELPEVMLCKTKKAKRVQG